MVAQNNAIRTNNVKAKIDKTQRNSKCRLCGDRDETITHIISECSKLAQKSIGLDTTRLGKLIYWELCKKFKFDHMNKWYLHQPKSVLENETHKILWDFEVQIDHIISARRPNQVIVNKKKKKKTTCRIMDFTVSVDHRVKLKESEKRDKYLDLARELERNYETWKWRWYQL